MSTCNFYNQKNFKLYIQSFEPMTLEEYLEEGNEEYNYESDMQYMQEDFYECIFRGYDGFKDVMDEFNDSLTFHELELKSGYYDGVQIYVDKKENPHELDNDDCNYYYDMCRSKAIRKYDAEIRKINKWMDKVAKNYGWKELYCLGVLSNGEAIYQYAQN